MALWGFGLTCSLCSCLPLVTKLPPDESSAMDSAASVKVWHLVAQSHRTVGQRVNLDSSLFEDNTATTVLSVTLPAEEFALIRFRFYFLLFFFFKRRCRWRVTGLHCQSGIFLSTHLSLLCLHLYAVSLCKSIQSCLLSQLSFSVFELFW